MSTWPARDIGFARLDTDRLRRTGDPEVVLASHKTPAQTVASLRALAEAHPDRAILATRCDEETRTACRADCAYMLAWVTAHASEYEWRECGTDPVSGEYLGWPESGDAEFITRSRAAYLTRAARPGQEQETTPQ